MSDCSFKSTLTEQLLCLCVVSVAAVGGAGLWSGCDPGPDAAPLRRLSRLLVGAAAALPLLVRHWRAVHRWVTGDTWSPSPQVFNHHCKLWAVWLTCSSLCNWDLCGSQVKYLHHFSFYILIVNSLVFYDDLLCLAAAGAFTLLNSGSVNVSFLQLLPD